MLVVMPICAKDVALAERNLSWCRTLEPEGVPFHAFIAAEEGTFTIALLDIASKYFQQATVWTYPKYEGDPAWPRPQNYAWQTVARHMAWVTPPDSWFWWEADVTPLTKGWLSTLSDEHAHGKKPFTGRIGSDGYMGGVAVYPPVVSEYSMNALLCRSEPFDSMLGKDIRHQTHAANHLIAHFPRYNRIRVRVEDPAMPVALRAKGYVLFHGCNDGSLVTLMDGGKTLTITSGVITRVYGVADISDDHDAAEPMWQYDAFELIKRGYPVLPFAACRSDVPSVVTQATQNGWQAGLFPLPHDPSQVHYNAGLVRTPEGLVLITRRWLRSPQGQWKSDMVRWKLDDALYPSDPQPIPVIPRDPIATYEDPRVVAHGGRYWVSYCVWRIGRLFRSHQAMTSYNAAWQPLATLNVPYGSNGWQTGSGTGHEKNWVWFVHDGIWHFVYSAYPHVVIKVVNPGQLTAYKPPAPAALPWPYGEIHGGTPPIRVGSEYITFFHSSLAWKGRKKRYYAGAYAFAAKPPFVMTRLTREPLLRGSEEDPRTLGGPLVVFAVGSVFENGEWLVSYGVNDEATGWVKVPHGIIDKLLQPIAT